MDLMYRNAVDYYMVGRMQLRDDEPTQDQRAARLLQAFVAKLMSLRAEEFIMARQGVRDGWIA